MCPAGPRRGGCAAGGAHALGDGPAHGIPLCGNGIDGRIGHERTPATRLTSGGVTHYEGVDMPQSAMSRTRPAGTSKKRVSKVADV